MIRAPPRHVPRGLVSFAIDDVTVNAARVTHDALVRAGTLRVSVK